MANTLYKVIASLACAGIILLTVLSLVKSNHSGPTSYGSAPSGLMSTLATTSVNAVSTTASTLFATSTCSDRVISTKAQAIMLTFSDYAGQTPTAVFGVLQSASTTVVYNGGQYGCGLVKAYAFGADTITLVETR